MESNKKPEINEALKSLSKFSLWTFAATIFRFGIRLLKNVVFTRILGPADRGIFGLLTAIPDLIVGFGNLGFGLGNTYLVAKERYDLKKIVSNTLLFTVLVGLLLAGVGYIVLSYEGILKGDNETVKAFLPVVLLLIPFVLLQRFGEDLLTAIKQINFLNLMGLCFSILPVILIVPLWVYTGEALKSAMYALTASVITISVWSIIKILSKSSFGFELSYNYFKKSLSYGTRGYLSIVADIMVRRIDVLFVSHILGATSLGLYAVSVSIAEILLMVPDAVNRPFLPIRLGLHKKDAKSVTPIVIRYVLFIMVLVCLCVAVGGKLIILILFGRKFLPAYSPVLWLLPGVLALSIYNFLKADMYSHNLPGFVSRTSVITLFCNLLFNYLLIPRFGINGAAISSSISYGLATLILLIKSVRLSGNSYRDTLFIKTSDLMSLWNKLRHKQ